VALLPSSIYQTLNIDVVDRQFDLFNGPPIRTGPGARRHRLGPLRFK
jgi:hypothetical protein